MKKSTLILMLFASLLYAFLAVGCGSSGSDTDGDVDNDTDETVQTDGDETESTDLTEEATGPVSCFNDDKCPTGQACHDVKFECMETQCDTDTDCAGLCENCSSGTAASCVCGADKLCYAAECTVNADCGAGYRCDGGSCCEKPDTGNAASCSLTATSVTLRTGVASTLVATAYAASGAVVTNDAAAFTWASSADTTVAATAGTATGGADTGKATVTATLTGSSVACTVEITNFADVASGKVRVIVVDIKTGDPVVGAKVIVNGNAAVDVPADGFVEFDSLTAPYDVHVFHADYSYVSAYGLNTNDIFLPIEPKVDDTKCGGAKGQISFDDIPKALKEDIKLAITAMQISGNLLDIDFMSLLGEMVMTHIALGSVVDEDVALPSGIELYISKTAVAQGFEATGPKGPAVAWSFGGYIPLNDLISIVTDALGSGGDIADIEIGKVVSQVVPFFEDFYHGMKGGLNIVPGAKVADVNDINGDGETTDLVCNFEDSTAFTDLSTNLSLNQRLNGLADVEFSGTLPTFPGATTNEGAAAALIAAADVTGVGLVPLGLTITLDEDAEGEFDGKLGDNNHVDLMYALQHSGVVGYRYFVLAALLDLEGLLATEAKGDVNVAAVMKIYNEAPTSVALTGFPTFCDMTFDSTARTIVQTGAATAGDMVRITMTADDGVWAVYMPINANVTLPAVPTGMTDRIATKASEALLSGIDLESGLDYDGLLQFTDKNLNQMNYVTQAFTITVKQ